MRVHVDDKLSTSEKKMHTGEKKTPIGERKPQIYNCGHCGEIFKQRTNYKSHLVTAHGIETEDDKKTKCKTCQKIFSSLSALQTHRLTHGKKNYLCSNCGKGCFR